MEGHSTLKVSHLTKVFSQNTSVTEVLRGIEYVFDSRKSYAITGVSGSGKSTLIHILAGLDTPTTGSVSLDNVLLAHFSEQERALKIGLVFQYPYLIKELSVIENVMLSSVCLGNNWLAAQRDAQLLLERIGLGDMSAWNVGQLSGGQKQRVALARTLLTRPAFLLADEMTGSLDHETGHAIMQQVLSYAREWGMGLIVSTHNPEIAAMTDLVFTLKDGILIAVES